MSQRPLFEDHRELISPRSYFENLLERMEISDEVPGWPDRFGDWLAFHRDGDSKKQIRVLSLFSGGGGLDIAFHQAGFMIIEMVEIDERYIETLTLNAEQNGHLYGAKPVCMDIKDFQPSDDFQVDFIIGGPPCQTFSAAGRRPGGVSGLDDPRGRLFEEYVRILEQIEPKGFLFENVYGIVGAQNGKPWKAITSAFEEVGYQISYRILDAADYGVPQHRERLIIVGLRDSYFKFPRPTHGPDSPHERPYYNAELAIKDIEDEKPPTVGGRYGHLLEDIPPGLNYSFYTEKMGHPTPVFAWRSKFSDFLYKSDPERPVRTIKAQGGQFTGPFHWDNRPFSLGELKRLQTIPDDYKFPNGRLTAIEQIGNSVPPQLGRVLALAVSDQVFNVDSDFEIDYLLPTEKLGFRSRKRYLTKYYRRKAKDAISAQYDNEKTDNASAAAFASILGGKNSRSFAAYLGTNFEWLVKSANTEKRDWNVSYLIEYRKKLLEIKVGDKEHRSTSSLNFEVLPIEDWNIPAEAVQIKVNPLTPVAFTGAWKAFEHLLIEEAIKADLVQLNGYYQYSPKLKMDVISIHIGNEIENPHLWKTVYHVLRGEGVRRNYEFEALASIWDLSLEKTVDSLVRLKMLGYQVRSSFTDSQIPDGQILIPYAFPSLNPKSVQLRKKLFPNNYLARM